MNRGDKPSGFDPLALPESNATTYPEAFRADNQQRWNRRLGNHAGLTNFGVNLTRIEPGGTGPSTRPFNVPLSPEHSNTCPPLPGVTP